MIASCADCHYPIGISNLGQKISCPMCGTENEAITGNPLSGLSYDSASIIGILGGALVGGILGYTRPKIATTIYGAAIGGGLGLIIAKAIKGE